MLFLFCFHALSKSIPHYGFCIRIYEQTTGCGRSRFSHHASWLIQINLLAHHGYRLWPVFILSQHFRLFHMLSRIRNMLQHLEQSPPTSFVEYISKLHWNVHVRHIKQSMYSMIHRYELFQCFFSMLMFSIICNQQIASYSIGKNQSSCIRRQALATHSFEPFQSLFSMLIVSNT